MAEKVDTEKQLKRRMSIATDNTAENADDANPMAFSGTAVDVDKLAEEEVGVLAMSCLKSIFVVPNRSQIQGATSCLLGFIQEHVSRGDSVISLQDDREGDRGWAIGIYNIISRWAPVQDRYIILVAALETLAQTAMQDDTLDQQVALVVMMSSLLRSDVNLIGLSVMDVLLGLIRQMRKLFRLRNPISQTDEHEVVTESEQAAGRKTVHLLNRIELCIGDLATHVYYADQITDMIGAVIARLKPARSSSSNSSPDGEKTGTNDAGPAASTVELTDNQQQVDQYFTLNAGRAAALHIIKAILLVANPQTKLTGNLSLSRNPVPVNIWEGTHWLLRDPDGHVRKAYMDALITWLDREATPADQKAVDESLPRSRSSLRVNRELTGSTARRAVSNTSHREKSPRNRQSHFLALLHLVIYDNALQFVEYENDLVMLHILLTKLVFKLGVNATRHGVPMVYRLQEDIQEIESPVHKVRTAALCHGYFWALTEKFNFEASVVGRAIMNEVVRRRSKGFWIEGIHIPPPAVDVVGIPGEARPHPEWDDLALEREELLPFDDRGSLVECIAGSYHESIQTPPGSPMGSPGRGFPGPTLGSVSNAAAGSTTAKEDLPVIFQEQMLTDWSRDAAVAMLATVGKSESLTGSKTGTSTTHRGHLAVNTNGLNGNGYGPSSPYGSQFNLVRPHSSQAYRERDRDGGLAKHRKSSLRSTASPSLSVSQRGAVASVDQLKQVLSGKAPPKTAGLAGMDDDSGDSMVSYDYSPSETSFNPPGQTEQTSSPTSGKRPGTATRRGPLSAHPPLEGPPNLYNENDESVPPVPPLPNLNLLGGKKSPIHSIEGSFQDPRSSRRGLESRGGDGLHPVQSQGMDLQDLLRGIDSRPSEGNLSNITRPPY